MSKPIVFFSHSSRDSKALALLKDLFIQKTGGSIEVFLSSDGQSIPLGRNWVHRIEEALNDAKLMFVFVSPASRHSSWLYFEAGYSYSKGISVVPVGFLGSDLAALPPPLGLLQGFNITSEDGLNNIITRANQIFSHDHKALFTPEEYSRITAGSTATSMGVFGEATSLIEEFQIYPPIKDALPSHDIIDQITSTLDQLKVEYQRLEQFSTTTIQLIGLTIVYRPSVNVHPGEFRMRVYPGVFEDSLPVIHAIAKQVRPDGISALEMRFKFTHQAMRIVEDYAVTGRLHGCGVRIGPESSLIYRDLQFKLGNDFTGLPGQFRQRPPHLSLKLLSESIPLDQIQELLTLLFERGILFEHTDYEISD